MVKQKTTKSLKERLFDGKRYKLEESHLRKELAFAGARDYRQKGRKARVIKRYTVGGRKVYSVYVYWG